MAEHLQGFISCWRSYSENLGNEIKEEVRKHHGAMLTYPTDCYQKTVQQVGIGGAKSLSDAVEMAMTKVDLEVDLFVLSLSRQVQPQHENAGASALTFNFYSPIGAVQTGPNATANIVMNLSSEDTNALISALDVVRESLNRLENLPTGSKADVVELADDAKSELSKPKPNSIRLTSIVTAIAMAIQTVGSLQPAYQALKAALIPFNILLP